MTWSARSGSRSSTTTPDSPFDGDDWLGDAYAPLPTVVGATAWGSLKFTQDGADYTMGVRVLRLS